MWAWLQRRWGPSSSRAPQPRAPPAAPSRFWRALLSPFRKNRAEPPPDESPASVAAPASKQRVVTVVGASDVVVGFTPPEEATSSPPQPCLPPADEGEHASLPASPAEGTTASPPPHASLPASPAEGTTAPPPPPGGREPPLERVKSSAIEPECSLGEGSSSVASATSGSSPASRPPSLAVASSEESLSKAGCAAIARARQKRMKREDRRERRSASGSGRISRCSRQTSCSAREEGEAAMPASPGGAARAEGEGLPRVGEPAEHWSGGMSSSPPSEMPLALHTIQSVSSARVDATDSVEGAASPACCKSSPRPAAVAASAEEGVCGACGEEAEKQTSEGGAALEGVGTADGAFVADVSPGRGGTSSRLKALMGRFERPSGSSEDVKAPRSPPPRTSCSKPHEDRTPMSPPSPKRTPSSLPAIGEDAAGSQEKAESGTNSHPKARKQASGGAGGAASTDGSPSVRSLKDTFRLPGSGRLHRNGAAPDAGTSGTARRKLSLPSAPAAAGEQIGGGTSRERLDESIAEAGLEAVGRRVVITAGAHDSKLSEYRGRVGTVLSQADDLTFVVQLQWDPPLSVRGVHARDIEISEAKTNTSTRTSSMRQSSSCGQRIRQHLSRTRDSGPRYESHDSANCSSREGGGCGAGLQNGLRRHSRESTESGLDEVHRASHEFRASGASLEAEAADGAASSMQRARVGSLFRAARKWARVKRTSETANEGPALPLQTSQLVAAEQALRDFLAGPELDFSIHISRFSEMLALLQLTTQPFPTAPSSPDSPEQPFAFQQLAAAFDRGSHKLPYASSRLLERLADTAAKRAQYASSDESKVLVAGAGPIGLRVAIEMRALGHSVTLIETRNTCSRLNILKLWPETTDDLEQLGLPMVDPKWCTKHGGYTTASTSRLQLALLKVALLFGATFKVGREFQIKNIREQTRGYDILLAACGAHGWHTSLLPTLTEQCTLHGQLEASKTDMKGSAAIAVVAHLECSSATKEAAEWVGAASSFDWSRQFFGGDKVDLSKGYWAIGNKTLLENEIALENVVCYPNTSFCKVDCEGSTISGPPPLENVVGVPPTFYFVFTLGETREIPLLRQIEQLVDRKRAHENGVATEPPSDARGLLEWALTHRLIDQDALHQLVVRVVERFTIEATRGERVEASVPMSRACRLLHVAKPKKDLWGLQNTMQIFDFTQRRFMSPGSAAAIVTHIDGVRRVKRLAGGKQEPVPLLVMPVGDALQEPFWPEGLGTNRGVHNARDAAWVANKWMSVVNKPEEWDDLLKERNTLYNQTLQLNSKQRFSIIRKNSFDKKSRKVIEGFKDYTVDPSTRYLSSEISSRGSLRCDDAETSTRSPRFNSLRCDDAETSTRSPRCSADP